MRLAIPLSVLLTLLAAVPASGQDANDWRADVDGFAARLVDAGLVPGMGLAVTRGDSIVHVAAYGLADQETGRRIDPATAFYIASSTKALTATAVVLLADRGEIDVDAPVTRYLPALRLQAPLEADSVSIESLLTMTHGIEDGGPVILRTAYTGEFTPELLIELLADYGPAESGRAFAYGNLGYNILGLVLDPDDSEGWKEVVRREVLDPLEMEETTARVSTLDPERLAMPHSVVPGEGFRRVALAKADANLHAAGGHFTTPRDLARFVAAHVGGGTLEGRRVFPAAAIASTHRTHAEQDREFGPFHRYGWGYGWDLGTFEGDTIVHRFGSFSGYRSHVSFMPAHGIGVIVLVNGDGPASRAADLMATYMYDRLLEKPDVADGYDARLAELVAGAVEYAEGLSRNLAERRARQTLLPHPLEAYAGAYEHPALGRMEWRIVDDRLEVSMGVAESEAEVYAAAQDQLRVELTGGGEVIAFTFPEGGGPAESLEYNGFTLRRADP
ncbi:MAG TPA: serine hydrolase [Gemmatimonadota bacterium]|nr:serine hydrolase [Gemmatimonadota bacterium]